MKDHVILNYLGQPVKLLIWEMNTVLTVCAPAVLLILMGERMAGLAVGGLMAWVIRLYKRRFGDRSLVGVSYWILPYRISHMPFTPPSYIREYIG